MTIEEFLETCEGVHTAGAGYKVICPAHEDQEASLGVTEGDDGRILLQCYAGCSTEAVLDAKEMTWGDLFPHSVGRHQEPEFVYQYTDEASQVIFEAVRFPGKRFRQRHYSPDHPDAKEDGWVWNLEGIRRVPFRLPELLAAVGSDRDIFIVEGEKDALRITEETGHFATCNPMGAGKWRDEFSPYFAGARVVIIQDRDEPGRRHAQRVKESLLEAGAAKVKILQAKRGKDVSDHFDNGFKVSDLIVPRTLPARGVVTGAAMAEAGIEYLSLREVDLPGYALLPGVEGSIVKPGRLYAGGGYTGDGKTVLALQGARAVAMSGVRTGYFSMEMSDTDLRNRLAAHRGIPLSLLEKPWELKQNPGMLALYHAAMEEMKDWPLDIIYDTTLKPERVIEDTLDREYEFVVIDHIHRFGWGDRRHLETSIQALTNLSLDANIPILVLAQLRRYQRGKDMVAYPPPLLQDFRETEMLGAEASIAFAIWRARDDEGLGYVGTNSHFRVLKNRHRTSEMDEAGHVEVLAFDPVTQLFSKAPIQQYVPEPDDPAWS